MNYPKNRYHGESPWIDKNWLYNEYVVKDRSTKNIAKEYGCSQNTIQQWLQKHKIKKEIKHRDIVHTKKYQEKDYLFEQIVNNKKSVQQIAYENNVDTSVIYYFCKKYNMKQYKLPRTSKLTSEQWEEIVKLYVDGASTFKLEKLFGVSHCTIRRFLINSGIETRTYSEAQFCSNGKKIDDRLKDAKWLETQHWELNKSCKDIGLEIGVDAKTVRRHMKKLGIKTKTNAESKIGLMTGENHPNWHGGITPLHLLLREFFNINMAPIAAKRDNYTCQKCGKTHTILNVHHIRKFSDIMREIISENKELDPNNADDKMKLYDIITHDDRFLDIDNLVTLCRDCHIKEHSKTISNQACMQEGSETIPKGSTP